MRLTRLGNYNRPVLKRASHLIWYSGQSRSLILCLQNLKSIELEQRILEPYRADRPIVLGGRAIRPRDLERIEIVETPYPSVEFREWTASLAKQGADDWFALERDAKTVTDDFVTTPILAPEERMPVVNVGNMEQKLVDSILKCISEAEAVALHSNDNGELEYSAGLYVSELVERVFVQTAMLLESAGLKEALARLKDTQQEAKKDYSKMRFAEDFYLVWTEKLRAYVSAFQLENKPASALEMLEKLLQRFHRAAVQLRKPSYAGTSTKSDFLLKNERLTVEVKVSSDNLKDSEIGKQLIIDIDHYSRNRSCDGLICLVYDPDHKLKNPDGLERDLTQTVNGFMVK